MSVKPLTSIYSPGVMGTFLFRACGIEFGWIEDTFPAVWLQGAKLKPRNRVKVEGSVPLSPVVRRTAALISRSISGRISRFPLASSTLSNCSWAQTSRPSSNSSPTSNWSGKLLHPNLPPSLGGE